jgi:hypothetical protein
MAIWHKIGTIIYELLSDVVIHSGTCAGSVMYNESIETFYKLVKI